MLNFREIHRNFIFIVDEVVKKGKVKHLFHQDKGEKLFSPLS